jgi:hypothetical protein
MKTATITRETSKYNKYMKWHLTVTNENGAIYSEHFKTEHEALYRKARLAKNDTEN